MRNASVESADHAVTPCELCQGAAATFLFTKKNCNLFRCPACGLVFVHPVPAPEVLCGLYSAPYFTDGVNSSAQVGHLDAGSGKRTTWQRKLDALTTLVARGRLLDVGAGPGTFVKLAGDSGWDAEGVEVSSFAVEYGVKHLGVRLRAAAFTDCRPEGQFDAITMWDFIEHTADPLANIRKAYALLRPGGVLALTTGDVGSLVAKILGRRWYIFCPPLHLYYFSRVTIQRLLVRGGFSLHRISYDPRTMTLGFAAARLRFLYGRSPIVRTVAAILERPPVRAMRLAFNSRDIMTVYATKPAAHGGAGIAMSREADDTEVRLR